MVSSRLWPHQTSQNRHPHRPIVSNLGTVIYGVTKELANIIQYLMGQSPHHIKNTPQFVEHIKLVHLLPGETMVSCNIKGLFILVPVDHAISIVQNRLHQDPLLQKRTSMSILQIINAGVLLQKTYFLFQGKYNEQVHGVAMGSPISPLIANMFIEEIEVKAISSAPPPSPLMANVYG